MAKIGDFHILCGKCGSSQVSVITTMHDAEIADDSYPIMKIRCLICETIFTDEPDDEEAQ